MTTKSANGLGSAKATTNHEEIQAWAEARGGHPALVKRTARGGHGGILRIDFPGFSGEQSLKEISWDNFFDTFEQSELAFLYQEQTRSGRESRFNKFVARASVAAGRQRGAVSSRRRTSAGDSAKRASGGKSKSLQRSAPAKKSATRSARTKKSATRGAARA